VSGCWSAWPNLPQRERDVRHEARERNGPVGNPERERLADGFGVPAEAPNGRIRIVLHARPSSHHGVDRAASRGCSIEKSCKTTAGVGGHGGDRVHGACAGGCASHRTRLDMSVRVSDTVASASPFFFSRASSEGLVASHHGLESSADHRQLDGRRICAAPQRGRSGDRDPRPARAAERHLARMAG
jgi:hypothetical protein